MISHNNRAHPSPPNEHNRVGVVSVVLSIQTEIKNCDRKRERERKNEEKKKKKNRENNDNNNNNNNNNQVNNLTLEDDLLTNCFLHQTSHENPKQTLSLSLSLSFSFSFSSSFY